MKKYLLLTLLLPLFSFGQQYCDTIRPPAISNADFIVYCVDSVSCHSYCDGRIEVNVWPVGSLYIYKWDSDSVAIAGYNIRDSLCAGTYGVTITDANGLYIAYQDFFIDEPSAINNYDIITNPTCFNESNGSINIITNGGTPPFSYHWSTGYTDAGLSTELNNISAGQYSLITIDNNLCSDTMPLPVDNPYEITSVTITDTLSFIGACDGDGVVIPFDGVGLTVLSSNFFRKLLSKFAL